MNDINAEKKLLWWRDRPRRRLALVSLYVIENNGIRSIAASLRNAGFSVTEIYFKDWVNNRFIPPTGQEVHLLLHLLEKLQIDIVGLSVRASGYANFAGQLTRIIRNRLKIPVIWGGMHSTFVPEQCIGIADIVCVGEAEKPMVEFMQALRDGASVLSQPHFWFRTTEGIVRNDIGPLVEDLDSLPFRDFHSHRDKYYIDSNKIKTGDPYTGDPLFQMMASRGCPFGTCAYCDSPILKKIYSGKGKFFRQRSPESVIEELLYAKRNFPNLKRIRFDDEIFLFSREWMEHFARDYKKKIGLPFECLFDARTVKADTLNILKQCGLDHIYMGIQNRESINFHWYDREITDRQVLEAAQVIHDAGIKVSYHLIVDDYISTDGDKQELFNLLMQIPRPFDLYLFGLIVYPRSVIGDKLLQAGLITDSDFEGHANRIFSQYRIDLGYPRKKEDIFWLSLFVLISKYFVPKWLLSWLARSRYLKKHPGPLQIFAQGTNLIKMGWLGTKMLLKGELTRTTLKRWLNLKSLITA